MDYIKTRCWSECRGVVKRAERGRETLFGHLDNALAVRCLLVSLHTLSREAKSQPNDVQEKELNERMTTQSE